MLQDKYRLGEEISTSGRDAGECAVIVHLAGAKERLLDRRTTCVMLHSYYWISMTFRAVSDRRLAGRGSCDFSTSNFTPPVRFFYQKKSTAEVRCVLLRRQRIFAAQL